MRENEIKKDIRTLSQLLLNWGKNVPNANILNTGLNCSSKHNIIKYNLDRTSPLIFKNIDLERHSIPTGIETLHVDKKSFEVHLSMVLEECADDDDFSVDPLKRLGVNIKIQGDYEGPHNLESVICSWHLDRDAPTGCAHCHPLYHLNFGGDVMTSRALSNPGYFGSLLLMPNPRLIHPPMDMILSCDFIIRNFYNKTSNTSIISKPAYKTILERASKRYWSSYAFAFASKWNNGLAVSNLSHKDVIGH
ncbi:hypothetical protein [Chryseobacterium indoltheticum]|jgi:hypothetical protein|uniref:hypothetical protein n=1 Tax=Chryseobacterium indoltheticum TaxID=254 RepID=UPI00242E7CAD|nr:hypothetical protein [Chryseobacterium indoltheticum]MDF2833026.1 hypothetical protein [Chryseobacterium indoltheticum]